MAKNNRSSNNRSSAAEQKAPKTGTILVKARFPRGFRRAGIHFTREGVEVDTAKLKKGQLEAILAEPNLVVVGEAPAAEQVDYCYRVLKAFEFQGTKVEPAADGQAPVSIQLSADDAEVLAADGFISTADGDVSLPPSSKGAE